MGLEHGILLMILGCITSIVIMYIILTMSNERMMIATATILFDDTKNDFRYQKQ